VPGLNVCDQVTLTYASEYARPYPEDASRSTFRNACSVRMPDEGRSAGYSSKLRTWNCMDRRSFVFMLRPLMLVP
jgi:hypothetical protein